jgi:hypothetical protein
MSPLRWIAFFDLVWDILPDMMHIIWGIWHRHIRLLLTGNRGPSAVRKKKKYSAAENAKLIRDHERVKQLCREWKLDKASGEELDRRSLTLAGEPSWIRSNIRLFSKGGDLSAHDWIQLVQSAGDYLFRDLLGDQRFEGALLQLRRVCNDVLEHVSPADEEHRQGTTVPELKVKVAESLSRLESVIPRTELCPMFHIFLHVPDCIYRWNSVRNAWCFFGERCLITIHT